MSTVDLNNLDKWIKEELFNAVPIAMAVIDREFNLAYANRAFTEAFGAWKNRKCFSVYKKRDSLCPYCRGAEAFKDGIPRVHEELGYNKEGRLTQYIQHTTPVPDKNGNVVFLVEMSIDITDIEQIRKEHQLLFDQVPCNILIIDRNFQIVKTNNRVRQTMGDLEGKYCYRSLKGFENKCDHCTAKQTFDDGEMHSGYHTWTSIEGQEMHQQVITAPLPLADGSFDTIMEMAVDITEIKKLEKEKLEAERLAAVGQTVAGLAHGIKNIITGLEGGMYMLSSGISKDKIDRVQKGLDMLQRNINRIAAFVKEFLNFSKGRTISAELNDPVKIVEEVVELYGPKAKELGIDLKSEASGKIDPALIDYESMHECLTNLVGNAIDACRMSDGPNGCHVRVRTFEESGVIIFEVVDNGCGMDYDVKQKVFTTFFTTKGLGGTGIGLLMTKKIVQEHGGKIEMTSEPGRGSTFRILLPRERLPKKKSHDEPKD
jgi:PAS domain S-box-containing protein